MSPEIRINDQLIADLPDQSGLHTALDGSHLWVDLNGIEARNKKQIIIIEGPSVGGRRVVGLTQEGIGNSSNHKKGSDRQMPTLAIKLHDRPIRITYTDPSWDGVYRRTYYNPAWVRK